jgi:pimeloyl-ACP methyl ester carboxylesterase
VLVTQADGLIVFEPAGSPASTGFIFYPGGGVDYRAYAPALRLVAAQGYRVALARMPLNLAFFDANAADGVIAQYPEIQCWAVGGHSLGGVAAASYASRSDKIHGLVLWASYPGDGALASSDLNVLSIYASLDGLSTPQQIEASRSQLPPEA